MAETVSNRPVGSFGASEWEREIDERVYRFYRLTEEEIKMGLQELLVLVTKTNSAEVQA